MAERGTNERRRVLKAAKIVWNSGSSVLDCTLRNVSKTGAMLEMVNTISVPDEFELRWDRQRAAAALHCGAAKAG